MHGKIRRFSRQLAGQIGESLVVAELGRLGIVATSFSGNLPDIDLLAYRAGQTVELQVKAWRKGSISFDARRFLDIDLHDGTQNVRGVWSSLTDRPLYIFVSIGPNYGDDEFYVLDQIALSNIICEHYRSFLRKHGGVRPRNAGTTHVSVLPSELSPFKNNWSLLEKYL